MTITRPETDHDLPPEEIHLAPSQMKRLASAIPFHHTPEEQERLEPVAGGAPAVQRPKRKWHEDHDPVLMDAGYDPDVMLVERHDPLNKTETPL